MVTIKFSQVILLGSLFVASAFSLSGCCTDQAAKVRAARPATVGAWGVAYRPTSNAGVVADLNGAMGRVTSETKLKSDPTSSTTSTEDRKFTTTSRRYDLGAHFYPSQKSAFYYGFGGEYLDRTTNFASFTTTSSLANPETTPVVFNDKVVSVGPSVGWDWIWENGVSVLMDMGSRITVSRNRTIVDDGTDGNVSTADRDATQSKIDKDINGLKLLSARLILGYSF